jgi:predicted nucleotide-binding protein (sugar kinase/HSP70/actin superfamily)
MELEWEIIDVVEILKGDWQVIGLESYDKDGNYYTASCETFISNPEIIKENITDIENHGKV